MADIVKLKDHFSERHKTDIRPKQNARILLFTGIRYLRDEPLIIGAPSLTGKLPMRDFTPVDFHPYER